MSRIGKVPISLPANVKITVDGTSVFVEGPKGKLQRDFCGHVRVKQENSVVTVEPTSNSRLSKAMYGTARAVIRNMVDGVVSGFSKDLELFGVGFRATVKGSVLDLALGYSHPINYRIPAGITVTVTDNTKIKVEGADKELVGQVAADIKHYYPVEPYKGKGVRIIGQFVRRKEGKKTA